LTIRADRSARISRARQAPASVPSTSPALAKAHGAGVVVTNAAKKATAMRTVSPSVDVLLEFMLMASVDSSMPIG
jgi:hypothetical protein